MADAPHILLVDDNADLLLMMTSMLRMNGFQVSTRDRGNDMEHVLHEVTPDLLLMDMLLSGTDGREVCKRLKSNDQLKHIPIVMISAHPNARKDCLAAGADRFIEKPFDMNAFLSKVRGALVK